MSRAHAAPGLIVLRSPDIQIVVNEMPAHAATQAIISSPPAKRESAAYKFFFTVPSLAGAATLAAALGGEVLPEQWRGPGFVVSNAADPEGNIFHMRESAPTGGEGGRAGPAEVEVDASRARDATSI